MHLSLIPHSDLPASPLFSAFKPRSESARVFPSHCCRPGPDARPQPASADPGTASSCPPRGRWPLHGTFLLQVPLSLLCSVMLGGLLADHTLVLLFCQQPAPGGDWEMAEGSWALFFCPSQCPSSRTAALVLPESASHLSSEAAQHPLLRELWGPRSELAALLSSQR